MDRNTSIPKVFMAEYVAHRGYYMAVHKYTSISNSSGHVMFYLLYKHQWNTKPFQLDIFFLRKARFIM